MSLVTYDKMIDHELLRERRMTGSDPDGVGFISPRSVAGIGTLPSGASTPPFSCVKIP